VRLGRVGGKPTATCLGQDPACCSLPSLVLSAVCCLRRVVLTAVLNCLQQLHALQWQVLNDGVFAAQATGWLCRIL
jgi:hypothetical protein